MNYHFSILIWCLVFSIKLTAQTGTVDESYSGIKEFEISVNTGYVTIKGTKTDQVKVKGTYDDSKISVDIDQNGTYLSIEERGKNTNNVKDSEWIIEMPEGIEMEVSVGVGDVDVASVSGQMEGNNGTGSFRLTSCSMDADLNSGTGHIIVKDHLGTLKCNSGTGKIKLTNFEGKAELNSGTGSVTVTNAKGKFDGNSGTGSVYVSEVTFSEASGFASGTGSVTVELASSPTVDLGVKSGTGTVKLVTNGHDLNGNLIMSCNKRRGKIVASLDFDKEWVKGSGKNETLHKSKVFNKQKVESIISSGTGNAILK